MDGRAVGPQREFARPRRRFRTCGVYVAGVILQKRKDGLVSAEAAVWKTGLDATEAVRQDKFVAAQAAP